MCEHLAAVADSLLRSEDIVCLCNPNFRKTCWVEISMNPLTPISSLNSKGFHEELLLIFSISIWYVACFLSLAASMPSSAGQVSSIS